MNLQTNADGLVELELLSEWIGHPSGKVVAVDPVRAKILVGEGRAALPGGPAPAEAWPLKTDPADYIDLHGDDPDPSERVAANLALARRIVGEFDTEDDVAEATEDFRADFMPLEED